MKNLFAILLCSVILFQSGLLSLQYSLRISQHKKSFKAALKAGHFDARLVEFSSSQFGLMKWENNHEFFLEGEKYDVVRVVKLDGETVYQCINDKTENQLINKLAGSENKSADIDEILKKIKLQLITFIHFEPLKNFNTSLTDISFLSSCYNFIFLKFINKPPNH